MSQTLGLLMEGLGSLPACYIQDGKKKSEMLARAVCLGAPLASSIWVAPAALGPGTPVLIGPHASTAHLFREAWTRGGPFVTVDNGYFLPYREGGHFRATSNAMQWDGRPVCDLGRREMAARLDRLGQEIRPWRRDGTHVLVVLQSRAWFDMFVGDRGRWLSNVMANLRRHTDRPIVVRDKPLKGVSVPRSLEQDLEGCHVVVGLSSNCLVRALLRGIPVVSLAPSAASPVSTPLERVDRPEYPDDRRSWAEGLAANQWTLEEMASGRMWRELGIRYRPEVTGRLA